MKFEEKITINAPAENIFQYYESVSEWHLWDTEIQSASLEGDFQLGATGKLKPQKGPEAKIAITEITKPTSFTVVSKLPLCVMTFEHHLAPKGNATEVTHAVTFTGLTAFLFGRLIGSGIKKGLPVTLAGLKAFVESKNNEFSEKMLHILTQVLALLSTSEDSAYTHTTVAELKEILSKNIEHLKNTGYLHDSATLWTLFAPTCALQETSMDNGWGEQYVYLAEQFDNTLALVSE